LEGKKTLGMQKKYWGYRKKPRTRYRSSLDHVKLPFQRRKTKRRREKICSRKKKNHHLG